MNDLPESAQRVADAAKAAGLAVDVREMGESTRTAEEAAAACGCDVGQIVKSLIFRGATSGNPVLLLVSGRNRVDETGVKGHIGEALSRPDAAYVRTITGYAIGGIPPLGHPVPIATYMDKDLMQYDRIFAAAGTPRAIFGVAPAALRDAVQAKVIAMKS